MEASERLVKLPAHTMNISLLTHSSFSSGPRETKTTTTKKKKKETDRRRGNWMDRWKDQQKDAFIDTSYHSAWMYVSGSFSQPRGLTGSVLHSWERRLPLPSHPRKQTKKILYLHADCGWKNTFLFSSRLNYKDAFIFTSLIRMCWLPIWRMYTFVHTSTLDVPPAH